MVDITGVAQTFCSGIGPILVKDGLVYLVLWAEQPCANGDGFERILVDRLVMSKTALAEAIGRIALATGAEDGAAPAWAAGAMDGRA